MRSSYRGLGIAAAAMALVVVVAGSWLGYQQLAQPGCTGQTRLAVAVAPEIADAVRAAATAWTDEGATVRGTCVAVDVAEVNPAVMAAAVATKHGVALAGVGEASGTTTIPDVWVPDSSMWLLRLRSAASGFAPVGVKSVAQSPVVVAMPEPVAQSIGWPDKKLGWADLLQQITSSATDLRTGIVDPTRDAAGLSGLLALAAAAGAAGPAAQQTTAGALRALATGRSALRDDLLEKFPRAQDSAAVASSLSAAPLSEEDVIAYNATKPPVSLAALYLDPAPVPLDYPFAVMPEADAARASAAEGLRTALNTGTYRDALAVKGLRSADGTAGTGFAAPTGAPSATAPSVAAPASSSGKAGAGLDASAIEQALGTWAAITLPGRLLAVFDVSGSMQQKVPTARNATRAQVTQEAARRGLGLFDDKWSVGVWIFSTELDGARDWRELVPISPLTSKRQVLLESLNEISPKRNGNTGLYDTVLAAYKNVQDGWEAGKVNSLVVFTDGKNADANGLSQDQLIRELGKASDPKRPIRLVIIGIGTGVDKAELENITKATGGGVFVQEDPAKIDEIFLKAISSRTTIVK